MHSTNISYQNVLHHQVVDNELFDLVCLFFFSMVSIVSDLRVHTAYVFSTRVCVTNMAAGGGGDQCRSKEGAKSGTENKCISEGNKRMVG